jgi:hypothetical protein
MGLRGSLVLVAVVTGLGASRREARAQAGPPPPYGAPAIAVAKEALHSGTFSRLILRLVGEDEIGVGKDEYRVLLLEDLRRIGYPALGAENLVFEQDHSGKPRSPSAAP